MRKIIAIGCLVLATVIVIGSIAFALSPQGNSLLAVIEGGGGIGKSDTAGSAGKGCGVARSGNGYSFSWLHVANGALVNSNGCVIELLGFNWAELEFGNAVGGSAKTRISQQSIAWYNQHFHMNVWRIPLNSAWWNTNVYVPLAHMRYRAWIEQVVHWVEQNGDYVILTKGPQFSAPPCGGTIKLCPSQNQASKDLALNPGDPQVQQEATTGQYIQSALTMWSSIAKIYANDPAVLYDSWNEMHDISAQTWQSSENALIATIRAQNPRSLIFLGGPNFKGNIDPLIQGQVPDFTQPNLVYDFHVYDGYRGTYMGKTCVEPLSDLWKDWPNTASEQVSFAQQHGKAVSFSEWGGCDDLPAYNQAITGFAQAHHIALVYYDEANIATWVNGAYQLTPNGQQVQAAYARLLDSRPGTA